MTRMGGRWLPLTILLAASGLLVVSVLWAVGPRGDGWPGTGPGSNGGMMGPGGGVALAGQGPVRSLEEAERAAARLGSRWQLSVVEVMQFDNNFYAELAEPSGSLATEVLVDPRTGAVRVEFGPAMMWNTAYGMHAVGNRRDRDIGPEQARAIAGDWLRSNRPADRVGEADAFPGYYTLHTLRDGRVTGMLSVHAGTGAVWYHSWHGDFLAMTEHN